MEDLSLVTLEGFENGDSWGYSAIYGTYGNGKLIGKVEARKIDGSFILSYLPSSLTKKEQVFGVAETKVEADTRLLENLVYLIKPEIKFSRLERKN